MNQYLVSWWTFKVCFLEPLDRKIFTWNRVFSDHKIHRWRIRGNYLGEHSECISDWIPPKIGCRERATPLSNGAWRDSFRLEPNDSISSTRDAAWSVSFRNRNATCYEVHVVVCCEWCLIADTRTSWSSDKPRKRFFVPANAVMNCPYRRYRLFLALREEWRQPAPGVFSPRRTSFERATSFDLNSCVEPSKQLAVSFLQNRATGSRKEREKKKNDNSWPRKSGERCSEVVRRVSKARGEEIRKISREYTMWTERTWLVLG